MIKEHQKEKVSCYNQIYSSTAEIFIQYPMDMALLNFLEKESDTKEKLKKEKHKAKEKLPA
jgi:hypothetical protein